MNKDKALEELFLAQKPHFDDSDAFMASLTKRLDAVEYIKRYQEATLRRYKMAMVVAFVAGIIGGAVGMAFLLSTPANVPLFTFRIQFIFLQWLSENSRIIVAAALSLLMSVGLISITYNIVDMMNIRARLKGQPLPRGHIPFMGASTTSLPTSSTSTNRHRRCRQTDVADVDFVTLQLCVSGCVVQPPECYPTRGECR